MGKKKIVVLGGSFNPPHYGHLLVAREVLKHYACDEVWLMPCFKQAEGKSVIAARERLELCRLALESLSDNARKRIKLSDFEIRLLPRKNYTADTVRLLKKRFPHVAFAWVFGSELVREFPHWGKWRQLRKLLPLLIYPRPGFKKPPAKFLTSLGARLVFLPASKVKKTGVSSTIVRELLRKNDSKAKRLVPQLVFDYIAKRKLYGWKP